MPRHIALLGDSTFDNSSYTAGEPDVVTHLRTVLPAGSRATLCAMDGATTRTLSDQLRNVPADCDHVVLSVGGNDALGEADLLALPVASTTEALYLFGGRVETFEGRYRAAVGRTLALRRPLTLCTIYNGNMTDPEPAYVARIALSLFNDAILRVAFAHGLDVIDLRAVCSEPSDYANPIEPSGTGGRKIAQAVLAATTGGGGSRVFGGSATR